MNQHTKGQIAILLCAALWSTSGLFIKIIDWHPMVIAGARSLIAAVFMIVLKYASASSAQGASKNLVWGVSTSSVRESAQAIVQNASKNTQGKAPLRHFWGAAISYSVCMMLFLIANKTTSSANAILLQYSGPVWAALLGWFLAKEKPRAEQLIAMGAVIIGMLIFFKDGIGGGSFFGDCMAVLSGIAFGAYSVFMRLQKDGNPADSMILSHLITVAVCLPFAFISVPAVSIGNIGAVLFMGIFTIGMASICFSYGIRHVSAVQALLLALIEPVLNPVWVFAATGEKPGISAFIGGGIIVAAVVVSSIIGKRRKEASLR